MLMIDRFKGLFPTVARIKRVASEGVYWELYDSSDTLIGYGFYAEVPETRLDIPDAEEFDKYEVTGIVDLNYKITALDITQHPDRTEPLWAPGIIEPEFEKLYLGLSAETIRLSPEGKIDAITEATISSKLITEAVRNRVEDIMKGPR